MSYSMHAAIVQSFWLLGVNLNTNSLVQKNFNVLYNILKVVMSLNYYIIKGCGLIITLL